MINCSCREGECLRPGTHGCDVQVPLYPKEHQQQMEGTVVLVRQQQQQKRPAQPPHPVGEEFGGEDL